MNTLPQNGDGTAADILLYASALALLWIVCWALTHSRPATEAADDDQCAWCHNEPALWNVRDARDRERIRVGSTCLAEGNTRRWWAA